MASFNKVILIGNMCSDPELKQSTSGVSVCSFSIAVNRKMAKNGEVDFINIQTWRQTAEFVAKYFTKGKPILVCGQLQTRTWTDSSGQKRYATEVVADEVSFVGANNTEQDKPQGNVPYVPSEYQSKMEEVATDSDLPF